MLDMKEISRKIKDEREERFLFGRTKEELDDGTVKGLVLSGDYREVSALVMLRNNDPDTGLTAWRYAGLNDLELYTCMKEDEKEIGGSRWKIVEEHATDAVTVCRRKFKKEDIILCALFNEDFDEMTGVVFTEHHMYLFSEGQFDCEIEYTQIKEVDFKEEVVMITMADENVIELNCANQSYSYKQHVKYMYNLIMDIKDRLEQK